MCDILFWFTIDLIVVIVNTPKYEGFGLKNVYQNHMDKSAANKFNWKHLVFDRGTGEEYKRCIKQVMPNIVRWLKTEVLSRGTEKWDAIFTGKLAAVNTW